MCEPQAHPHETAAFPTADAFPSRSGGSLEFQAFPISIPEEDPDDFRVQISASTLRRCRSRLKEAARPSFPWHELCLGLSTLAMGATGAVLHAGAADLPANSRGYLFYYSVLPCLFLGFFIAYIFLRNSTNRDPFNATTEALRILPDPDGTN